MLSELPAPRGFWSGLGAASGLVCNSHPMQPIRPVFKLLKAFCRPSAALLIIGCSSWKARFPDLVLVRSPRTPALFFEEPKHLSWITKPANINSPKPVRPIHQLGQSVLPQPVKDERKLPRGPALRTPGDGGRVKFIARVVGQQTMLRGVGNVSANTKLVTRCHDSQPDNLI